MKDETNRHSSCHQWCRQNQEKLIYKMFCYFRKYQKINNSASRGMISTEFRANRPFIPALPLQLFIYCFNGKFLPSLYNPCPSILVSLIFLWGSILYPSTSFAITPPDLLAQTTSQGAVDLLNQGLQAIQAGKVQDAIASFKKAVLLDPKLAPPTTI